MVPTRIREKLAWHEAGHVTMALLLDVPILSSVVTGHIDTSATKMVTDNVTSNQKVALYLGGALGQYLQGPTKEGVIKAVARLLRSAEDANHDYLAAVRLLVCETGNVLESRRVLEREIYRAHQRFSDPRVVAGLKAVAAALLEASPNALRGCDLQAAFKSGSTS